MIQPVRIQRKRTKGWRMPENTVSVTRPGKWGNPFTVANPVVKKEFWGKLELENIEDCLKAYRLSTEVKIGQGWLNIEELRGKNLACFCPLDKPCHADILLQLANK